MPEHIGEHSLGLIGIGQVHDDARPLLRERVVGSGLDTSGSLCFLAEIKEGLTNGVLVAKVGELSVEDRVVSMHADLFFTVGEDAEFSDGGFRQVPNHPFHEPLLHGLTGFLSELEDVGDDGTDGHFSAGFEEIVNRCGGHADAVRDFEQTRVAADQQGTATRTLRVFAGGLQGVLGVVREDDNTESLVVFV